MAYEVSILIVLYPEPEEKETREIKNFDIVNLYRQSAPNERLKTDMKCAIL